MGFIDDIVSYYNTVTLIGKAGNIVKKNDLINYYNKEIYELHKKTGYNNPLIDILIEKDIVPIPIYIISPWGFSKIKSKYIYGMGVYRNRYGTIFYDYGHEVPFIIEDGLLIKYPYPDSILMHYIFGQLEELIEAHKDILKKRLSICKSSEKKSTIE